VTFGVVYRLNISCEIPFYQEQVCDIVVVSFKVNMPVCCQNR